MGLKASSGRDGHHCPLALTHLLKDCWGVWQGFHKSCQQSHRQLYHARCAIVIKMLHQHNDLMMAIRRFKRFALMREERKIWSEFIKCHLDGQTKDHTTMKVYGHTAKKWWELWNITKSITDVKINNHLLIIFWILKTFWLKFTHNKKWNGNVCFYI